MHFGHKISFRHAQGLSLFFAHKKGGGASRNGRDSKGRRLGSKVGDGQIVKPGTIIYRQRGTKIHPGINVKRAKDDTLFSLIQGRVRFEKKSKNRKQVSVYSNLTESISQVKNKDGR